MMQWGHEAKISLLTSELKLVCLKHPSPVEWSNYLKGFSSSSPGWLQLASLIGPLFLFLFCWSGSSHILNYFWVMSHLTFSFYLFNQSQPAVLFVCLSVLSVLHRFCNSPYHLWHIIHRHHHSWRSDSYSQQTYSRFNLCLFNFYL